MTKPRRQDVMILFVAYREGVNLFQVYDMVNNRSLFGLAPRRECEDWTRGHTT